MFKCRACRTFQASGPGGRSITLNSIYLRTLHRSTTATPLGNRRSHAFRALKGQGSTSTTKAQEASAALKSQENKPLPPSQRPEWVVRKHLQYLKDPVDIANHVERRLEKGKFEEALLLVRTASAYTALSYSWNSLIRYLMNEQRLHAAIKLFNEMKKRRQKPTAATYTIIFSGCANSIHPKLACSEALRIYNSMLRAAKMPPNIIHFNAVLKVCSRAGDLDSIFTTLSTGKGNLKLDGATYTTILNALRQNHKVDGDATPEARRSALRPTMNRAKTIWEEVVQSWRKGELVLDEPLVSAMAWILAAGERPDQQDVLALLAQTMQLPRFDEDSGLIASGTGSEALPKAEGATRKEYASGRQEQVESDAQRPKEAAAAATESTPDRTLSAVFASSEADMREPGSKTSCITYARPGPRTLSILLDVSSSLGRPDLAIRYWRWLREHYKILPDNHNYRSYLRLLRNTRATGEIADTIRLMPRDLMDTRIFRLGLSACVHDTTNPTIFESACIIFDTMTNTQRYPDPESMRKFLEASWNFREQANTEAAKLAHGRQLVAALDRMWEPFRILMSSFSFPEHPTRSPEEHWRSTRADRREVFATARIMVGMMDKIVTEQLGEPNIIKLMRTRRNILNKKIIDFYGADAEMERRVKERQAQTKRPVEKIRNEEAFKRRVERREKAKSKKSLWCPEGLGSMFNAMQPPSQPAAR